jgi:hypothetical protein
MLSITSKSCSSLLAAALLFAAAAPCLADDDDGDPSRAESIKTGFVGLCRNDDPLRNAAACKDGSFERLAKALDAAAKTALARAHPPAAMLLKRDQVWFRQTLQSYADNVYDGDVADKGSAEIVQALQRRATLLGDIAQGLGRNVIVGRWVNALGTIEIAPAAAAAFRVTLSTDALYGPEEV